MTVCAAATAHLGLTVLCERESDHEGPHHGHVCLVGRRSYHEPETLAYDWYDEA